MMKFQTLVSILFLLLNKRRVTARELADRYAISRRTVYRYVNELICAGIPIDISRGTHGGISISDTYTLPKGLLSRKEYEQAIVAMQTMEEQTGDMDLRAAIDKLSAQAKTERADCALSGNFLIDSGTWGDERKFSERLRVAGHAVEGRRALSVDYIDRTGERTKRVVLPHLLVYKQNVWYLYAYCRLRQQFRLFKLGRMRTMIETEETFARMPFSREDIPLSFWREKEMIDAVFSVSAESLPLVEEWLGVDNLSREEGVTVARVSLPDDESLAGKILSMGAGVRVLAPAPLAERVAQEARRIAEQYVRRA